MPMLDYVVHAPVPYRHRSAGFRALYKLADELQKRGKVVALQKLPMRYLAQHNDPCPFDLKSTRLFLPADVRSAVHIVPEIVLDAPARKSVRWILNPNRDEANKDKFLEFDWHGEQAPRLCVDVIEKEWFYPKSDEGAGLVLYGGKHGSIEGLRQMADATGDKIIDQDWPMTRQELGEVLRGAEGMISYDNLSMINLEATICGTPVLMGNRQKPPETLFGTLGMIADENDFEQGREEAKKAAAHYEDLRNLIANDVDHFIKKCDEHFS